MDGGNASGEVAKVRRAFEGALDAARRDWLLGSGLTVVLAPVFVAVALGLLVLLGGEPVRWIVSHPTSGALAIEVFLAFLFLGFFLGEPGRARWGLVGVAAGGLAALALLAHATPLPQAAPGAFRGLYGVGVFVLLGVLGLAYTPRDDYELGLGRWLIDNPLTLRDDIDRAHLTMGVVTALPRFVLGAASDVVSGSWAVRGLAPHERQATAEALLALGRGDGAAAQRAIGRLGPTAAGRVLRALEGTKLVRPDGKLTTQGSRLLAASGASLTPLP